MRSHAGSSEGGVRAQSEVLGVVLLFGLVLTVSLTIVVVGAQSLDDARTTSQTEDAALTFAELQSEAAELSPNGESTYSVSFTESQGGSAGAAQSASVEGGTEGNVKVDPDAGTITVETQGSTVVDRSLGRIEYVRNGQKLVYQGGGTFRGNVQGEESVVESPPPFDYQYRGGDPTLSLPIRTISTDGSTTLSGNEFTLEASSSERQFPSGALSNPLESGQTVTITIESDYYLAWGDLFEDRTTADTSYNHASDEVTITLSAETAIPDVEGALTTGAATGNVLNFDHKTDFSTYHSTGTSSGLATTYVRGSFDARDNNAGQGTITGNLYVEEWMKVESNSGSDPFSVTGETLVGGASGTVTEIECKCEFDDLHVTEELQLRGSGNDLVIHGDVYVDGDLSEMTDVHVHGALHVDGELSADANSATVDGNVIVSGDVDASWGGPDGTDPDSPTSPDFPPNDPVSLEIDQREDDLADGNDNPDDGTIQDIENSGACDPCELDAGEYYVDGSMVLDSSETLDIDTSGGAVEIYVKDGVEIDQGTIDIDGDNPVLLFNDGDFSFTGGQVNTAPDSNHAPAFWVYMHPDADVVFDEGHFVGVIYAPGSDTSGELSLSKHTVVRGAVVAELESTIDKHTEIRFDEALLDESPDPGGTEGQTVGYLQVSTTDIEVRAGGS